MGKEYGRDIKEERKSRGGTSGTLVDNCNPAVQIKVILYSGEKWPLTPRNEATCDTSPQVMGLVLSRTSQGPEEMEESRVSYFK